MRKTLHRLGGSLALLALAACSPAADDTPDETASPAGGSMLVPANVIPDAYLGTWDYVGGSCDPASDLLLQITPDELVFYESAGRVTSVEAGNNSVTINLAMSGEGESWDGTQTFRLLENGMILESDLPAPTGEGNLQRKKCEG